MSGFLFKICGTALLSAMLILLLRKWGAELSVLVKIAAAVALAAFCLVGVMPVIENLEELSSLGESEEIRSSLGVMLRVLSVATVTHICAGICRDCGEVTLGSYVEMGGKVEILILSLPMIREVIDLAVGMM